MHWYKIELTADQVMRNAGALIAIECNKRFLAASLPPYAALFGKEHPDTSQTFYLTPDAAVLCADIISSYNGQQCSAPSVSDVDGVEVGTSTAQDLLTR